MSEWRPAAGLDAIVVRAELLARVRKFFALRGVMEVETPLISVAGNSDPGIRQFSLHEQPLWLRTSPEYAMKRMLAAGSGDIYELGRVFRAGESGRHHNREFTILEWYRIDWTYHQLMNEVEELVRHCFPGRMFRQSRVSYRDLLIAYTGIDPMTAADERIANCISSKGIKLQNLERQEMLDLLISLVVQPGLPENTITFVFDFPVQQAVLAKIRADDPPVAERFELFLGSLELANGYQELTDGAEQRQRFEYELQARDNCGDNRAPLDQEFLEALDAGIPECAGVARGVDRLLMAMLGVNSLEDVLAFPAERA